MHELRRRLRTSMDPGSMSDSAGALLLILGSEDDNLSCVTVPPPPSPSAAVCCSVLESPLTWCRKSWTDPRGLTVTLLLAASLLARLALLPRLAVAAWSGGRLLRLLLCDGEDWITYCSYVLSVVGRVRVRGNDTGRVVVLALLRVPVLPCRGYAYTLVVSCLPSGMLGVVDTGRLCSCESDESLGFLHISVSCRLIGRRSRVPPGRCSVVMGCAPRPIFGSGLPRIDSMLCMLGRAGIKLGRCGTGGAFVPLMLIFCP